MSGDAARAQAKPLRHPVIELLDRHLAVLHVAWKHRRELAGPARLSDEAAFLPAALSLQETPPHPAPRRAAWAVCALFVIALTWATIGEIDIVAVAPGRIVVSDRTKTLQPLEASVVKRVLVKDGDSVQAGQVLVELDATNASADSANARELLAAAESEARRTTALRVAMPCETHGTPHAGRPRTGSNAADDAQASSPGRPSVARRMGRTSRRSWRKLEAEQAHRRRRDSRRCIELIAKLEATLPLARQREADFKQPDRTGFHVRARGARSHPRAHRTGARPGNAEARALVEAQAALRESENNAQPLIPGRNAARPH